MPLALGFVALLGAVLLVTHGLTSASYADIVKGNARQDYQTEVAAQAAQNASLDATGTTSTSTAGAAVSATGYTNPLQKVTKWLRTDQGVDANMPVGAPIVAPGKIRILGIVRNWYEGQPLIYWELLDGPDAGKVQYAAEQITNLAAVGSTLQAGQTIATYAASGSGLEFGWGTKSGRTLAAATTGYTEGQITRAGASIRSWLNSVGANAGANT